MSRNLLPEMDHVTRMVSVAKAESECGMVPASSQSIEERLESITTIAQLEDSIDDLRKHGLPPGRSTGWIELDKFVTIPRSSLTVVTGIPSHGKSEFIDALICNLIASNTHRMGWAIFSAENRPLQVHVKKLFDKVLKVPMEDSAERDFHAVKGYLNDRIFFVANNENPTLENILDDARLLADAGRVNGLLIDPWNTLEHKRPSAMSETEYIASVLGKLRSFSQIHGVHVIVVAHPTKIAKDKDGRYPCPTPYDISGSAHWRNMPDICLAVNRPRTIGDGSNIVEVHVQKVRFKNVGKQGGVTFSWNRYNGTFTEIGPMPGT